MPPSCKLLFLIGQWGEVWFLHFLHAFTQAVAAWPENVVDCGGVGPGSPPGTSKVTLSTCPFLPLSLCRLYIPEGNWGMFTDPSNPPAITGGAAGVLQVLASLPGEAHPLLCQQISQTRFLLRS